MKKTLMLATAAAVLALGTGAGFAQEKKQLVIVVKGSGQPLLRGDQSGLPEVELRERRQRV